MQSRKDIRKALGRKNLLPYLKPSEMVIMVLSEAYAFGLLPYRYEIETADINCLPPFIYLTKDEISHLRRKRIKPGPSTVEEVLTFAEGAYTRFQRHCRKEHA